ncbi:MAG: hypothetical protein QW632_04205 [Ignisphaera sp.]
MKRPILLAIPVLLAAIGLVFAGVAMRPAASSTNKVNIDSVGDVVPANMVVLGEAGFRAELERVFGGKVKNFVAVDKPDVSIARYADRGTVVIISDAWLEVNAKREDTKELIKTFAEAGSPIYVSGPKAGLLLKILDETGVSRFPRIPENAGAGIGYIKVSKNFEVVVYGDIKDLLSASAEYSGYSGK